MAVHRNVHGARVERRGVDLADAAPLRHIFGRDVGPVLSLIASNLDETVIGANPDQAFGDGRLRDREDGVVVFGTGVVESDIAARRLLLGFVVAREVWTDRLPVHATVRSFEKTLACMVERAGVVRRKQHGCGPLETMLQETRAVSVGEFRLLGDRLHLSDMPVVARNVALVVGGINNVWIGRVRRDVAGFASAHVIPIGAVDDAVITAAGDGDRASVLLRAVNAIGRSGVGDDVVELRGWLILFGRPVLAAV